MLRLRFALPAAAAALAVQSCGSSPGVPAASATGSGAIAGNAVPTADAYSEQGDCCFDGSPPYPGVVTVTLASSPGTCSAYGEGFLIPGNASLVLTVEGRPGVIPGAGTYAISPTVTASFVTSDANCDRSAPIAAVSGAITLSSVSTSVVSGSFDLTWTTGDHVTGTFAAPDCSANYTSGRPGPFCRH